MLSRFINLSGFNMSTILIIMYFEKATKFCEISIFLCSAGQKEGEDFAKFCGLLRIYELYHIFSRIYVFFFTWNFLSVHFLAFKNKIDVAPIVKLAELKSFENPYEIFPKDILQFEFFLLIIFRKFIVKWNKD